ERGSSPKSEPCWEGPERGPGSPPHPWYLLRVEDERRDGTGLVETCIRKGLPLKAHRVVVVGEEPDAVAAEIARTRPPPTSPPPEVAVLYQDNRPSANAGQRRVGTT